MQSVLKKSNINRIWNRNRSVPESKPEQADPGPVPVLVPSIPEPEPELEPLVSDQGSGLAITEPEPPVLEPGSGLAISC